MSFEWLRRAALRVIGWVFILLGLFTLPRGLFEGIFLLALGIVLIWYGMKARREAKDESSVE